MVAIRSISEYIINQCITTPILILANRVILQMNFNNVRLSYKVLHRVRDLIFKKI